ncbi:MAG TPA: hypothetical protein VF290_09980 [Pyrinomonadaceae bacterium]
MTKRSPPRQTHGFHNDTTPRYDEEAAKLAWLRRSKRKVNRDNSRFVKGAETREQSSSLTDYKPSPTEPTRTCRRYS